MYSTCMKTHMWFFPLSHPLHRQFEPKANSVSLILQVIKQFSIREGWWYLGIKGDGGVKRKGTRLLIEKEK